MNILYVCVSLLTLFIAALLRAGAVRKLLNDHELYAPEFLKEELCNHEQKSI